MDERTKREKKAYDEDNVWEISNKWHKKFNHVFTCPNSLRYEKVFYDLIKENITGKRVLELGCGKGGASKRLFSFGADYIYGIDVSEKFILEAKKKEIKGKLEFSNKDVTVPIEGKFDIIFGKAILHHVNYRSILERMYSTNLNSYGFMVFIEPLGSSFFMRLWFFFGKKAHTPDEKPLYRKDLKWLVNSFQHVEIIPINYFSFLGGILSSMIFSNPNNFIMQVCDKIDYWIAKNIKFLKPNFRQAIIVIKKSS